LEVDSRNLSRIFHPIPEEKMSKILENLANAFITSGNLSGKGKGNQNFHAEFTDLLKHDAEYNKKASVERFLTLSEQVIVRWQREAYEVKQ